jgi:hypothetical protein
MDELIKELVKELNKVKLELNELRENTNNPNPVLSGFVFPEYPYNNQIFCLIGDTTPEGGTLYRYDENTKNWLSLV